MESNKVKFNLLNVHIAKITAMDDLGVPTYAPPKRIPGAVSLSFSPEGEMTPFYADGIEYYTTVANNGYSGDLEIAMTPDWFRQEIMMETMDATNKVLVENANVEPASFAFLFQVDGDKRGTRFTYFNSKANRANMEASTTTDTKEPQTDTLSINISPLADGRVRAKTTTDTPEEVYDTWFNSVWGMGATEQEDESED